MSCVLLTASGCPLCEHARTRLAELDIDWREVRADTPEGRRLAAGAPPFRPVLYDANGTCVAYGRLSIKRLRKQSNLVGEERGK